MGRMTLFCFTASASPRRCAGHMAYGQPGLCRSGRHIGPGCLLSHGDDDEAAIISMPLGMNGDQSTQHVLVPYRAEQGGTDDVVNVVDFEHHHNQKVESRSFYGSAPITGSWASWARSTWPTPVCASYSGTFCPVANDERTTSKTLVPTLVGTMMIMIIRMMMIIITKISAVWWWSMMVGSPQLVPVLDGLN
jgi:hypothetical protein